MTDPTSADPVGSGLDGLHLAPFCLMPEEDEAEHVQCRDLVRAVLGGLAGGGYSLVHDGREEELPAAPEPEPEPASEPEPEPPPV